MIALILDQVWLTQHQSGLQKTILDLFVVDMPFLGLFYAFGDGLMDLMILLGMRLATGLYIIGVSAL
jgi:hypothetical protein